MESSFRAQYEPRGKALTLRGTPVKDMNREELIAAIGFLFHQAYGAQATDPAADDRQPTVPAEIDLEYPPSNNGLMEG